MTGPSPATRPVLPSRQAMLDAATEASNSDGTVFIVGQTGSGRTTFALQLLERCHSTYLWVIGSPALKPVPFSSLSLVTTRLPNPPESSNPTALVAALGQATSESPLWLFLDQAEHVDDQSAAIFRQFALSRQVHLVITCTSIESLPLDLSQLLRELNSQRVDLEALTFDDAQVLLEDLLQGPVNTSTVTNLVEFSAGHAIYLRELALEAQNSSSLKLQGELWTLDRGWNPDGTRLSDLVATRLKSKPEKVRRTVQLLAITGPLNMDLAKELVGDQIYEAMHLDLVQLNVTSQNSSTGERTERVRLGTGLSPELVLGSLSPLEIRNLVLHIEQRLSWDQFDLEGRGRYTHHRLENGIEVPTQEYVTDVAQSADSGAHTLVLALTGLMSKVELDEQQLHNVVMARAHSLYQVGRSRAAVDLLRQYMDSGDTWIRFLAAKVAFAGLGQLSVAEEFLVADDDDEQIQAYRLLIHARASKTSDLSRLQAASELKCLPEVVRAELRAQLMIEMTHAGRGQDALADFLAYVSRPEWTQAAQVSRSELLFALPPIIFGLGLPLSSIAEYAADVVPADLHVDHGNYLVASAWAFLEAGKARPALDALEHALSLLTVNDPYSTLGFTAAFASHAARLLGLQHKAAEYLALWSQASEYSGQILRPWAQMLLVPVILDLQGRDSAQRYFDQLLQQARRLGRRGIELRLELVAWQCGLIDRADRLSEAASRVQGPLAEALHGYRSALQDPTIERVSKVVQLHVASGHQLLAAQFAFQASDLARSLGRRSDASFLLNMSIELASELDQVNTYRLGRGRIRHSVLTDREYDVCLLASHGASNHEISKDLYLSTRTVEGHLQRAYAKLGISDRRQLLRSDEPSSGRAAQLRIHSEELPSFTHKAT